MTVRGANGQPVEILTITGRPVEVDAEIAPIVAALNAAGLETIASCSGHGFRPADIVLRDGREIIIARDFDEARRINLLFPLNINGRSAMLSNLSTRLIAMIAGGIVLVVLALLLLNQCQSTKTAKKQAEVSKGQAGASIGSGEVAVKKAAEVMASDDATDAQVAAAQATIAAAAKGQKGAAAKRAACGFKAYRDAPQCREPKP